MALLGLVLLMSVHALRYQLTSRSVPDYFTSVNGPTHHISFVGLPTKDSVDWTVSAWTFITATADMNHELLRINSPFEGLHFNKYFSNQLEIYGMSGTKAPGTALPIGVWMHAIMGVSGGILFGVVTLRDGTQYTVSRPSPSYFTLRDDTEFQGAGYAEAFTVRKM